MKFILVIWLVTPANFAEYETFSTSEKCQDKLQMVKKALKQAESTMQAECWKVEPRRI